MSRYRCCCLLPLHVAIALWLVPLAVNRALAAEDTGAAQEPKESAAEETVDRYAVPEERDVAVLLEFIQGLQQFRPTSAQELLEHRRNAPGAIRQAAEKILDLEKDTKSEAYQTALGFILQAEVQDVLQASPEARKKIYDKVKSYITSKEQLTRNELGLAFTLAMMLERSGAKELAVEAYNDFGTLFQDSDDEQMAAYGAKMIGSARRVNLLGNDLVLKGKTVDGQPFDWDSYRGKVVLVDFWATWCGPCIAELPNVKKHYELYHDKGFDVVGISLDADREKLETFIKQRELPWTCLFEDDAGWDHPLATYYGVMSIPTVLLVDKQGKVVNLQARGPVLGRELTRLLGPVEETVQATDEESE